MSDDERERLRALIEVIDAKLPRWRLHFPNEESEVEVPRRDLLLLAETARAYLAEHPEPPALTREGIAALRAATGDIDVDAVREFRGEQPADDGELIDETWLRAVGFRPPASKPPCPELGLGSLFARWYPESAPQGTWYFNHRDVPAPVTRGQVRRLCEALGEELAESKVR